MNNKKIFFIVLALFSVVFLYSITSMDIEPPVKATWSYTKFMTEVNRGIVNKVQINGDTSIDIETHSGDVFVTYAPEDIKIGRAHV